MKIKATRCHQPLKKNSECKVSINTIIMSIIGNYMVIIYLANPLFCHFRQCYHCLFLCISEADTHSALAAVLSNIKRILETCHKVEQRKKMICNNNFWVWHDQVNGIVSKNEYLRAQSMKRQFCASAHA